MIKHSNIESKTLPRNYTAVVSPAVADLNTAMVDEFNGVVINHPGTPAGAYTLGTPTDNEDGKVFTIVNDDISVAAMTVNGHTITPSESITFQWEGTAWATDGGFSDKTQTLTATSPIQWDTTLGTNAIANITSDVNLDDPTGLVAGQSYTLVINGDGTERTVTPSTGFVNPKKATLEPFAVPASGTVALEFIAIDTAVLMQVGASGLDVVDRVFESVNMTAHGLAVLTPVYHNGTGWVAAQASASASVAQAIVTAVTDVDNFEITTHGVATVSGHGLTVGEYYWLDQATAALTATQPTSGITQSLVHVRDANTIFVDVEQAIAISSSTSSDSAKAHFAWNGQFVNTNAIITNYTAAQTVSNSGDITFDPVTGAGTLAVGTYILDLKFFFLNQGARIVDLGGDSNPLTGYTDVTTIGQQIGSTSTSQGSRVLTLTAPLNFGLRAGGAGSSISVGLGTLTIEKII